MSKDSKSRQQLRNDLDWLNDRDSQGDLPEFLKERKRKGRDKLTEKDQGSFREHASYWFRSMLAVILCLVIPFLWFFNWDLSAAADETSDFVTGIFENDPATAPFVSVGDLPELPAPPPVPGDLEMSMSEYTAQLNERGYLDKLSGPAVSSLYSGNVPVSYLNALEEAGYLVDLSFPAIISFYNSDVPIDYLRQLDEAGFLEELSFPAIISYYNGDVPIDYLSRLNEAGLLDRLSFPAVTAFYNADVTIEFLQDLDQKELLDQLSFPDIVSVYQNQ